MEEPDDLKTPESIARLGLLLDYSKVEIIETLRDELGLTTDDAKAAIAEAEEVMA